MTEKNKYDGLGGWLILVGIGIIISPLRIVTLIFPIYTDIFSNGVWEVLTTPGTEVYNSLWAPVLMGEVVINGGLVIAWLFMAFLFFSKKKVFPKWYISIMVFTLLFIFLDALAMNAVLPNEPVFDPETIQEFVRQLIATIIWVPYMLVSKRVQATFIK
ncbi:DUF2569 domain-containing protein [Photobacterium frigidiphilum]|uniref:DUF2569 domain-containing protein n=3 Tax=Vibrionaceae TaxID=641 RepID=UPI003D151F01